MNIDYFDRTFKPAPDGRCIHARRFAELVRKNPGRNVERRDDDWDERLELMREHDDEICGCPLFDDGVRGRGDDKRKELRVT